MKLIYLHQYFKFPDESGGTRSYDLAKEFVKRGIDVTVITATSDVEFRTGEKWMIKNRDGLKVHYVYVEYDNNLSYFKRIMAFLRFLWLSAFRLIRLEADVVLATSTPLTIGVPALIKKWISRTPYIFEVRDVWPEAVISVGVIKNALVKKVLYKMEYVFYKNAFAIVPLSVDMKTSIVSRYPALLEKPIVVIENISEIDRFKNKGDNNILSALFREIDFSPRFTVLYAGTFGKVNGVDYVVRLAKKVLKYDSTIVFVLIGTGGERVKIINLAKENNILNKNFFVLEPIAKNDLSLLYSEISIGSSFVIDVKELWANSANKFFDTLAAGKPILINHGGWQSDIIKEKNIGYVLPVNLSEKDIEKFVSYTLNVDLQRIQGENALRVANEDYSLMVAVNKYMKILQDLGLIN